MTQSINEVNNLQTNHGLQILDKDHKLSSITAYYQQLLAAWNKLWFVHIVQQAQVMS